MDLTQYNFEHGTQRWMDTGAPIAGEATSTVEAFAGCQSLAVHFNGTAGTTQIFVANPGAVAGKAVTVHVWIPKGSAITSVQPFVQQRTDAGLRSTGTRVQIGNLIAGGWNTMQVAMPANAATPLSELGVEFTTNATWTGTLYVDSVGW
jgi:hypothetical protein